MTVIMVFTVCETLRLKSWQILPCLLFVAMCVLLTGSCSSSHGFVACPASLGITNVRSTREMTVMSTRDCARQCRLYPDCQSVNVEHLPGTDGRRSCMHFAGSVPCGDLQNMDGYTNYRRIDNFHSCAELSPGVIAAVHRGNDSYMLVYGDSLQEFALDDKTLFSTACPEKLADRFLGLSPDNLAAFARDVIVGSETIYFLKGSNVHQYIGSFETSFFPSYFSPWPMSLADFFGAGVPNNIDAVLEDGDRFYILSGGQAFVSQVQVKNTVSPSATMKGTDPSMNSDFVNWTAITASAVTAKPDVHLLFSGNVYYVYDHTMNSVLASGRVCSNL